MARIVRTYVLSPEVIATLSDLVAQFIKNPDLARHMGLLKTVPQTILTSPTPVILDHHGLMDANITELTKLLNYARPKPSTLAWDAALRAKEPITLAELMEYAAKHPDPEKMDLARAYVKQSVKDNRAALRLREQAMLRRAMNPMEDTEPDYSKSINNSRVLELLITLGHEHVRKVQEELEVAAKKQKSTGDGRTSSNAAKTQTQLVNPSPRSQATA